MNDDMEKMFSELRHIQEYCDVDPHEVKAIDDTIALIRRLSAENAALRAKREATKEFFRVLRCSIDGFDDDGSMEVVIDLEDARAAINENGPY